MGRTYGALVLAGGNARRMEGRSKALLRLDQGAFLSRLEKALGGFEEKLLSKMAPLIFLCLCGIFQFANVEFCAILIVYVKFL